MLFPKSRPEPHRDRAEVTDLPCGKLLSIALAEAERSLARAERPAICEPLDMRSVVLLARRTEPRQKTATCRAPSPLLRTGKLPAIRCSAMVLRRASNIAPAQIRASCECREPPPQTPPDTRPVLLG